MIFLQTKNVLTRNLKKIKMKRQKFIHILWLVAIILAVIAILGQYRIVTIIGISNHNFELLLISFLILLILRLFKR